VGRSGGLLAALLLGGGLFRLGVADETLSLRLTAHAVGLRVDDARRVALYANPERGAEVERLFVREPEFSRQFVHADVRWQVLSSALLRRFERRAQLCGAAGAPTAR